MRTIKWHLDINFVGDGHNGEIEVPDNATEGEIQLEVEEKAWNYINLYWEEKK